MEEFSERQFWISICIVIITMMFSVLLVLSSLENKEYPVYKIIYIDLDNNKQVRYGRSVISEKGTLSFIELNSTEFTQIHTNHQIEFIGMYNSKEFEVLKTELTKN